MFKDSGRGKKRTLRNSFADAFRGIWGCVRSERNMRIHLTLCCYVLFFGFRMGLSRGELACLVLTIGVVMGAEAMNTSVEKLCDFTEKHWNPRIRVIKDIAAGAVLLCARAAVLVGGVLFLRPALWQTVLEICSAPLSLCLFFLSAVLAWSFIFIGPTKIKESLFSKKKGRR